MFHFNEPSIASRPHETCTQLKPTEHRARRVFNKNLSVGLDHTEDLLVAVEEELLVLLPEVDLLTAVVRQQHAVTNLHTCEHTTGRWDSAT